MTVQCLQSQLKFRSIRTRNHTFQRYNAMPSSRHFCVAYGNKTQMPAGKVKDEKYAKKFGGNSKIPYFF